MITRADETTQMKNSQLLDQLVFAVYQWSTKEVAELLHESGSFFGKQKNLFLAQLNTEFKKYHTEVGHYHMYVNRGIALDKVPGAEVIEIRFDMVSGEDDFFGGSQKKFGEAKGEHDVLYRWCTEFKDGKIFRLHTPKKFTSKEVFYMDQLKLTLN